MLTRVLKLLLVFAALSGLAGQAVAAVSVQNVNPTVAAGAMSVDCMKMMGGHNDAAPKPCDGTFKCMLAMGCLSLAATTELGSSVLVEPIRSTQAYWPALASLRGASDPPEQHPPTILG